MKVECDSDEIACIVEGLIEACNFSVDINDTTMNNSTEYSITNGVMRFNKSTTTFLLEDKDDCFLLVGVS